MLLLQLGNVLLLRLEGVLLLLLVGGAAPDGAGREEAAAAVLFCCRLHGGLHRGRLLLHRGRLYIARTLAALLYTTALPGALAVVRPVFVVHSPTADAPADAVRSCCECMGSTAGISAVATLSAHNWIAAGNSAICPGCKPTAASARDKPASTCGSRG